MPLHASLLGRFGNVEAILAALALLAMARTAHLPVALGTSGAIVLMLLASVARRRVSRRERAMRLMTTVAGIAAWIVVVAPQAWLMWRHEQLVPGDSALWGVGGDQLLWSQQMGKYATVVASCPGVAVPAAPYPAPFVDAVPATGKFVWFLYHPHVALWHLFQSLNWDFPTTYISTFNPLVTVPLNAVGLGVVVVGFATLASVGPSLVRRLIADAPVLGIVLLAIGGLWLQTAFTAVESRFGIIPWAGLSVASVWGATQWWGRLRHGASSLRPAIYAALATGVLLLVSRLAVAGVPVFQQYEDAGCWGDRQCASFGIQSTSDAIRYKISLPRRTSDRMSVKLILARPYLGPVNLRIDVSGRATGFMTTPERMANVREFNFDYALFRDDYLIVVNITPDGVDRNLRLSAWRNIYGRTMNEKVEYVSDQRIFTGLPDALTGRMTSDWWPMVWVASKEWDYSLEPLRWPF